MTHTPGPWTMDRLPDRTKIRGGGRPFASVDNGTAEGDANARLIAAAPELLDLVRTFYSYIGTMQASDVIAGEPWMENIRPLLAKIEGA